MKQRPPATPQSKCSSDCHSAGHCNADFPTDMHCEESLWGRLSPQLTAGRIIMRGISVQKGHDISVTRSMHSAHVPLRHLPTPPSYGIQVFRNDNRSSFDAVAQRCIPANPMIVKRYVRANCTSQFRDNLPSMNEKGRTPSLFSRFGVIHDERVWLG